MNQFCPSCGEPVVPNTSVCAVCGTALMRKTGSKDSPAPALPVVMTAGPPDSSTNEDAVHAVVITQQPAQSLPSPIVPQPQHIRTKNPQTAMILEYLGMIGFLGIGHIYSGRASVGIVFLILWFVFFYGAGFALLGFGFLCNIVIAAILCTVSGRNARKYVETRGQGIPYPTK